MISAQPTVLFTVKLSTISKGKFTLGKSYPVLAILEKAVENNPVNTLFLLADDEKKFYWVRMEECVLDTIGKEK